LPYSLTVKTLDSLKNHSRHSLLIEEINKVRHLSTLNWNIHFGWVKAHIRIDGNEAADKLAEEASHVEDDHNIVYKIPATTVATEINMKGLVVPRRDDSIHFIYAASTVSNGWIHLPVEQTGRPNHLSFT